jgi:hypothetical protein
MEGLLGLAIVAFLLLILVNSVSLAVVPKWAVRQSWSILNERRMRNASRAIGLDYAPSEADVRASFFKHHQPTLS